MMKTFASLFAGATASAVLIVACSDDSPSRADAAACDCPAAEPPLAGRVMRVRGLDDTLVPGGQAAAGAMCPAGSILLHGWCDELQEGGTRPEIAITSAGASPAQPNLWACIYKSYSTAGPNTIVHAEAVCLMPAQ
ncbi:MAG: hypothetical protein KBG48_05600 [Kofleriaceae bacterium]|jgi:hypothetical protein|nr:hypothetical protein [Kofleriaceae bacterium]